MTRFGYARVSTVEQNEARQVEALVAEGIPEERIFTDKASGKNTDREGLRKLLNTVRAGDEIFIISLDRLARSTLDLLNIVKELEERGVFLRTKDGKINTTTPEGKFNLTILAAVAQLEREMMLERQREGIAIAKREGKYKGNHGHEKRVDDSMLRGIYEQIKDGSMTKSAAAEKLGITRPTLDRKLKNLEAKKAGRA
jgi:DNA invertase Pin-like site-specific DNA recombinase